MLSFYARRSQKLKKDSQLKQLFALSGSVGVKANIHVDEIDPRWAWRTRENGQRREISKLIMDDINASSSTGIELPFSWIALLALSNQTETLWFS